MTAAKTRCSRCGAEILQVTANLTHGHCMPCADALARANYIRRPMPEPILNHRNPEEGVILSARYLPGFATDLTSWTIQISSEGVLRQAVSWYPKGPIEGVLLDPRALDGSQFSALRRLLEKCPPDAFQRLERAACIVDVATVSLLIPQKEIRIDLPYFYLHDELKKGRRRFDETEQTAFSLFGQLWRLVDQLAPYSLAEHQKGRTRRGS